MNTITALLPGHDIILDFYSIMVSYFSKFIVALLIAVNTASRFRASTIRRI
jgi:hypothetical protein